MASAHPFHSLIKLYSVLSVASQVALVVKNLPANAGDVRDVGLIGKVPWRRKWQLTPVFLLGKSHGQRSLVGHSLWDHKEVDRLSGWLYVCFTESGAKPSLYFCLQGFCSFCSVFFSLKYSWFTVLWRILLLNVVKKKWLSNTTLYTPTDNL